MSLSTISQTALSGIRASETMLTVAADNLANLETPGFKQSQVQLSTQPPVGPLGAQVGTGVQVAAIAQDTSQGALLSGNGPLNLAISGGGYFILEGPEGEHLYTRDGSFHANADGQLVSSSGHRVLGLQGDSNVFQGDVSPLFVSDVQTPSATDPERNAAGRQYLVSSDGAIRRQMGSGSSQPVGRIRLAQFQNPNGLRALGDNLQRATASSGPARVGNPGTHGLGRLTAHGYEASNSDLAHNLINMSRAELLFRANLQVLSVADSLSEELMNLLRR